jgi:hypothetical protein
MFALRGKYFFNFLTTGNIMKKIFIFIAALASITFADNIKIKCTDKDKNIDFWELSKTLDTLYNKSCFEGFCDMQLWATMKDGNVIDPDNIVYADTTKIVYNPYYLLSCKVIHKTNKLKQKK